MTSLFSKPKTPKPIIVPPPPTPEDPAIKEAAAREAERLRRRKGSASTILTGPGGLSGQADVLKEKLG